MAGREGSLVLTVFFRGFFSGSQVFSLDPILILAAIPAESKRNVFVHVCKKLHPVVPKVPEKTQGWPARLSLPGQLRQGVYNQQAHATFFPSSSHCTNTPSALHFNVANTASPDKSAAPKTLLLPTTTIVKTVEPSPHRIADSNIHRLPTNLHPTKMSSSALTSKDVNASVAASVAQDPKAAASADVKSMEYHRQVLQSKIDNQSEYASPFPPFPLPNSSHQRLTRQPPGQSSTSPPRTTSRAPAPPSSAPFGTSRLGSTFSLPFPPAMGLCCRIVLTRNQKQGQAQIAVCPRLA